MGTTLSLGAADITWINASGGDWNTTANWSPNQVPGLSDKAILALGVTVTVDAPSTVGDVALSNATLSGSGNLTVNGTLNWTGGTMNGAGATTIASGGSLVISGGNNKGFSQRTINNAGTLAWSGTGNLDSGNGAAINNQAGGVFDLRSDQTWNYNLGGNPPVLNNAGTLQKTGGTGTSTFGSVVNNDGSLLVQSGTVNLVGSSFSNGRNGMLQGSGTIDVSHTAFTTDGQFSPGNPLGALLITGNLPQSSNGVINIQIGGTNAGVNYDQLIITGNATLKGALNITLVNGFQPSGGETFEIIKYASHTGSFDNISGLNLGNGFYLQPTFGSTTLILTTIDNRPRPQFSPPQLFPNGDIHFTLTGVAGQTFIIEVTTDFSNWAPVLTNVNSGAVFDLIITDSTAFPYRFYRSYQP